MKYKVGDKFLLPIEVIEIDENDVLGVPYKTSVGRYYADKGLDGLRRPDDMTADEAWKLAEKIMEMPCGELAEIFPECEGLYIMRNFPPQEAKAKIEAWEAENDFRIGDVVRTEGSTKAVVLNIHDKYLDVLVEDGCAEEWYKSKIKKTSRHIDIQSMLEQIGGEE